MTRLVDPLVRWAQRLASAVHRRPKLALALALVLLAGGALLAVACDASGPSSQGEQAACPAVEYEPHAVLAIPADGDIADPHVIRVDCVWYLYATNDQEGLDVWLAEDLRDWRHGGRVWEPRPGTWAAERAAVWAPHVEVTGDGYYLYYTAALRIGVAWAASPLGPFEDVHDHPFVGGGHGGIGDGVYDAGHPLDFDEYAIDAFVLATSDGSLTFYFAAYDPLSRILAVPMADYATLAADEAPQEVLRPDTTTWEGVIVEAPWVVEHEGRFHLMYSGSVANPPDYAMGAAVGDSPHGPFGRYPGNPLLQRHDAAAFYGPGHHSLVAGAADGERLLFYHTQSRDERGHDRRIRYVPVVFGEAGRIELAVPPP